MGILKDRFIIILILLAFLVRLIFVSVPGFISDVNTWYAWALKLSHFDFSQFYSKDFFSDYTPGYLYILSMLGFLKNLLGLQNDFFYFFLKLPAIIADLIVSLLVYLEIRKRVSYKSALLGICFLLFNPAVIFNSSIWGQIDSIPSLLMLTSIIALKRKQLVFSSLLFGLALLTKPQAIALAPLMLIFLLDNLTFKNMLKITIPGILAIFVLSFPFFPKQTLLNLIQHIINTANEYPYSSLNAYNFWGLTGFWILDTKILAVFSYQIWGYILFAGYWLLIGYLFFVKKVSIYTLATMATLAFFFLPTRVHERYLYPALIFLTLTAFANKSRASIILLTLLSLLHFFNLYYVYIYYNQFYYKLPSVMYNPTLYNFLATNNISLSLISMIIFILISIVVVKYENNSKTN